MTKKAAKGKTLEERTEYVKETVEKMKGQIDARIERLAEALNRGASEELLSYLKFSASFYRYSFQNQLLIMLQSPTAERVASFKAWQEKGRQVKKGAKAVRILAPRLVNDKETPYIDGKPQKKLVGFTYVSVFAQHDTEGDDLPGDDFMTVQGGDAALHAELIRISQAFSVKTEWKDCEGAHGMTNGGIIWLDPVKCAEQPAHALRVWLHEAAHTVLHFKDAGKRAEDCPDRETRELEADACAYVLGTFWGIEQAEKSADYIRVWGGDADKLRGSLNRVQIAVAAIICQIAPDKVDAQGQSHSAGAEEEAA